jgi:hypothetical protein
VFPLDWFKKAYVFTFYVQYRCATAFCCSKWGEENAVLGMGLLQAMLILEAVAAIALLTGRIPLVVPKTAVVLGYLFLLLFTYLLLVRKRQWRPYKVEFERYSKRKHFFASLAVGMLMVLALLGLGVLKRAIGGPQS